jgi:thiosulfate/3-mercaptopyruvate sulfurtransferase
MPNSPRDPNHEYLKGPRIPHAIRWDLDLIATKSDAAASAEEPSSWKDSVFSSNPLGLGHMFPSPATFAQACSLRGIKREDHVVLYDSIGVFSSPRGAWTFKVFDRKHLAKCLSLTDLRSAQAMGHEKVSVLDGGLPRYLNEGLEVENQELSSEIPEGIEVSGQNTHKQNARGKADAILHDHLEVPIRNSRVLDRERS